MILVKDQVRKRDNFTCQKCGKSVSGSDCQVSHVSPVSHGNRLAFDPINMKVLCLHDHLFWWHLNPIEAGEWFKNKFPDRYEYINLHKNEVVSWTRDDYQRMINEITI